jgi:hypothetical protein
MPMSKNIPTYWGIEVIILSIFLTGSLVLVCLIPPCIAKDSSSKLLKTSKGQLEATIEPGRIHEKCLKLISGQALNYSFEASRPMDFNIHYHKFKEVIYPVTQKSIFRKKSLFNPEREEVYCMMWSNPSAESISLTYQFQLTEKKDK